MLSFSFLPEKTNKKMNNSSVLNLNSLTRKTVWLVLICWLPVSFAALAGMYQLWWQRERVLYVGSTVTQQRKAVFQRAGFAPSLVDQIDSVVQQWPSDIRYTAHGAENSLSYIEYLLLPRIPAEDSSHTIQIQGEDKSEFLSGFLRSSFLRQFSGVLLCRWSLSPTTGMPGLFGEVRHECWPKVQARSMM
jgi:hypothetical protein